MFDLLDRTLQEGATYLRSKQAPHRYREVLMSEDEIAENPILKDWDVVTAQEYLADIDEKNKDIEKYNKEHSQREAEFEASPAGLEIKQKAAENVAGILAAAGYELVKKEPPGQVRG